MPGLGETKLDLLKFFLLAYVGNLGERSFAEQAVRSGSIDATISINGKGTTLLGYAATMGFPDFVQFLLENGANPNIQDREGLCALHYAVVKNNPDVVKVLTEKEGVDLNLQSAADGYTPLHLALAIEEDSRCADILLDAGADYRIRDNDGNSAFILAMRCYEDDKNKMKAILNRVVRDGNLIFINHFLINGNWGINYNYYDDMTLLHMAVQHNQIGIAKYLLENGAEVNLPTRKGVTALHVAANKGNTQMIEMLMQNGADINSRDENGFYALHHAVIGNQSETVKTLIEKYGANPNCQSHFGRTPLHLSINSEKPSRCTEILLELGADYMAYDDDRVCPLTIVHEKRFAANPIIDYYLINRFLGKNGFEKYSGQEKPMQDGQKNTPLHIAAKDGDMDMVKILMCRKWFRQDRWEAALNVQNEDGKTAIHLALENGHKEVAEFLMDELTKRGRDNGYERAISTAARLNYVYILGKLSDEGVDIDQLIGGKSTEKSTPLSIAASRGNEEAVRFLLKSGADIDGRKIVLKKDDLKPTPRARDVSASPVKTIDNNLDLPD